MMPVDRFSARPVLVVASLLAAGLVLVVTARRVDRPSPGEVSPEPARHHDRDVEQMRAVRARVDRKVHLVRELLAGQLTLLETAARFRALDLAPPRYPWEVFRATHAGDSDEERH